jgi:xanthine dehydrogenase large subunit
MNKRVKEPHQGVVHAALPHDSARLHVTGEARYVDDVPEPEVVLHAYFGVSDVAHGLLEQLDLDPVRRSPGVLDVLTAGDIPGLNDISPTEANDEPILAAEKVEFIGQPLFAVVADTRRAARQAARKAIIKIEPLPPVLDITEAMAQDSFVGEPHAMQRGNPDQALAGAPHRISGEIRTGGQDHFYLEGQVSLALPGEDGEMRVLTSSQHPTEVQHTVARALAVADHRVTVEVRRMGGAFGGKETQAAQWAVLAALCAQRTGRPVKLRLDRDEDMVSTGKRHDFLIRYEAGFDDQGRLDGIRFEQASRCGMSADLSGPIADRAMFHSDNAYYLPNVSVVSHRCRTNTVSNTAFRGFGGPQGMMGIERVMDHIATHLGRDPLEVRLANLYGASPRDITPYYMQVEDNVLDLLIPELREASDYDQRRADIETFNRSNPVIRRGIALTPVKFGISFTTTFLNQAGALVHVYTDGSIQLNHGGTEMGQGLMTKVSQVVADEFGVDLERVRVTATSTDKVPNTTATAASAGSDMNGMAARAAARKITGRIRAWAAEHFGVEADDIGFANNSVQVGAQSHSFAEIVRQAWQARIQLSATGFYRTPKIHYDRDEARGRPFLYFAYGAAVSEVEVDSLTGEYQVLRADLLHDVGHSLNPAIDLGQIEGGFIQGVGWLTTEALWWDESGHLRTHAPSTYKIPTAGDIPPIFNAQIWQGPGNREDTIHRSKAVGEPPLMLGISVHCALVQAIASLDPGGEMPALDAPATPEEVLRCCQAAIAHD